MMLANELSKSSVGIFVMTRENLGSKWLHFEAGAIAKSIERGRVCTLIFDLEPTDIEWPLGNFQATRFVKGDVKKLFMTINAAGGEDKLADATAEKVFEKWWPELEKQLKDVLAKYKPEKEEVRSQRDLIEEILLTVRGLAVGSASTSRGESWLSSNEVKAFNRAWQPMEIILRDENSRETEIEREDVLLTLREMPDVKIVDGGIGEDDEIIKVLVRSGRVPAIQAHLRAEHRVGIRHFNVFD